MLNKPKQTHKLGLNLDLNQQEKCDIWPNVDEVLPT